MQTSEEARDKRGLSLASRSELEQLFIVIRYKSDIFVTLIIRILRFLFPRVAAVLERPVLVQSCSNYLEI